MEQVLKELTKLLPTPITRDDILILIQKVRMNLLKIHDMDDGDYDKYIKGNLELGNIKRYQCDIREIVADYLFLRGMEITTTELDELSDKITNFTMNQNII
jgi:hypothetical protein